MTHMQYKSFNENEVDVYPSIGLCFTMAIKEGNLKLYGYNVTPSQYAGFLQGYTWDSNLMKVDYENVIQQLHEYIVAYGYTRSGVEDGLEHVTLFSSQGFNSTSRKKMPGLKELSFLGMKCLTIDIPSHRDVHLDKFWLYVRPEIFLQGIRPSITTGHPFLKNRFIVQLHYPKQCLRYITRGTRHWSLRDETAMKSYVMRFNLHSIEVMERRNKYWKPCDINFPDLDNQIKELVLERIGCKPPYWNSSSSLTLCSKVEEMRNASKFFYEILYSDAKLDAVLGLVPCRVLERISFDAADVEFPDQTKDPNDKWHYLTGSVGIYFDYKESNYKEVKHVRSMDGQALIGN